MKTGSYRKVRTSEEFFDSLVENAIDFLKRSVSEMKKSPKYSVIDFCAALEIFLKARLLVEHWSLIVSRPEVADLSKFKNGDFQSVSMDEAIRRLRNIWDKFLNSGDIIPISEAKKGSSPLLALRNSGRSGVISRNPQHDPGALSISPRP